MNLIDRIGHSFIMTFGITQPRPGKERSTHTVIVGVLVALVSFPWCFSGSVICTKWQQVKRQPADSC